MAHPRLAHHLPVKERLWRPPPARPYVQRDAVVTSAMMSHVGAAGNRAESRLRSELSGLGLRYRRYHHTLIGRPDIVFVSARLAVFVDGDFWHGRGIIDNGVDAMRATLRTPRREWWIQKLLRTIQRDTTVTAELRRAGWRVIRVWESDVLRSPERAARRVARAVERRLAKAPRKAR